jgi:hypothetical protein
MTFFFRSTRPVRCFGEISSPFTGTKHFFFYINFELQVLDLEADEQEDEEPAAATDDGVGADTSTLSGDGAATG